MGFGSLERQSPPILKVESVLIEFDGFYLILTTFAKMFKTGLGMKKHIPLTGIWIAVVLMTLIVACDPPKETVMEPMEKPLPELAAIDSLMWRQPDSAFAVLKQFVASPLANNLDVFNGYYCQLLISELLYKNDYMQSNRNDLMRAVDYFDSLTMDTNGISIHEQNVFLDARTHYINGVGYYEQKNMEQACSEYLKALEVMEGNFQDQALTGIRAIFMFYTYNRLLELFSAQFMMASAIKCGEKALAYCQKEPSLSKEIPNTYFHIGKQYDKMGEKNTAREYYGWAIEGLSDINSLIYRDAVSMKALCDYQVGHGADSSLSSIKQVLPHANSGKEKLTRLLVIGSIFTVEQSFDSALYYLIPVFENNDDISFQIQAAEYLLINYNNLGNKEKADECTRFLGDHKKPEGEDKALVSKLEDMYKDYINQKQEKEAEEAREQSIRKTVKTIVPIAIIMALAVFVLVKLRSKKLLKKQQEEADRILGETEQAHEKELRLWQAEADKTLEETKKRYEEELRQLKAETEQQLEEVERRHQQWMAEARERHDEELRTQKDKSEKEIEKTKKRHVKELETERLAYEKEQDALRQNLKEKEAEVIALEKTLNLQQKAAKQQRMAFLKEPICQHILDKARSKQITTRDVAHELGIALKDKDFEQLGEAVEKHYEGFDHELLSQCPSLKQGLLSLCHLHLLGLNESEIAALKNLSYSAIKKQNESLQEKLGVDEDIASYILRAAERLCGTQNGTQGGTQTNEFINDDLDAWIERQIKNNPKITTEELAEKSHKGVRTIKRHISMMGHIHYVGSGYSGHWEVSE